MIASLLDLARANAALIAVLAPLAAAAACVVLLRGRASALIAAAALGVGALSAVDLATRFLASGTVPAQAQSPLALRADGVGVTGAALVSVTAALLALAAPAFRAGDRIAPLSVMLMAIASSSWIGVVFAGDIASFAAAAIAGGYASIAGLALTGDRAALSAAFRSLAGAAVAGCLLIAGGALLWRDGGALVFSASAAEGQLHGAAIIGVALALAALALMAGAAPLHVWSAPASVRGEPLMAAALGSAGAAALTFAAIRAAAHTFTTPALAEAVAPALLAMGAVGAIYAAVQALGASDLRRIAAYLGAAQLSCVIMAVATGSASGYAAALIQTAAFTASALGLLVASPSPARFVDIDGLARRAPLSSFALTVATLNLMGAPLTLGFLARWRMIETYIGGGSWWIVGAIVAVWLVALVAGARVIERVYFRRASVAVEFTHNPWRVCAAPSLLFAVLLSLSGAHPAFVLRLADAAAGAAALARGP